MIHRTKNHVVGVDVETLYSLSMGVEFVGCTKNVVDARAPHVTC